MKVAIYTLTRDRLAYSKRCFRSLWQNAGYPVDHFVIDNGSADGTDEWLANNRNRFALVCLCPTNIGISRASNLALDIIGDNYDLIVKMDNDCEIVTANLVAEMVKVFRDAPRPMMLSPRVEGINRQPKRAYTLTNVSNGNPIEGATVTFATDSAISNVVWSGTTDTFGVARDDSGNLPYLAAGTYYIQSRKAGFTFAVDTETVS